MSRNVKEILHTKLSHEIQTNKQKRPTRKYPKTERVKQKNIPKNIFTRLKYQIQTHRIFLFHFMETHQRFGEDFFVLVNSLV